MGIAIQECTLFSGRTKIRLSEEYEALAFQVKNGNPTVWIMFNTDETIIEADVILIKTGTVIEDTAWGNLTHIGTVQADNNIDLHAFIDHDTQEPVDDDVAEAFLDSLNFPQESIVATDFLLQARPLPDRFAVASPTITDEFLNEARSIAGSSTVPGDLSINWASSYGTDVQIERRFNNVTGEYEAVIHRVMGGGVGGGGNDGSTGREGSNGET